MKDMQHSMLHFQLCALTSFGGVLIESRMLNPPMGLQGGNSFGHFEATTPTHANNHRSFWKSVPKYCTGSLAFVIAKLHAFVTAEYRKAHIMGRSRCQRNCETCTMQKRVYLTLYSLVLGANTSQKDKRERRHLQYQHKLNRPAHSRREL